MLVLLHPLTNFEIQICYQNKTKFNVVYLRNNLPKINDRGYVINLDDYESIRTHWVAFYMNGDNVTYFNSFGVEYISKRNKKIHKKQKLRNKCF